MYNATPTFLILLTLTTLTTPSGIYFACRLVKSNSSEL